MARGQKFMCCVRNPRNINIFVWVPGREDRVPCREDRVPGVTEKLFVFLPCAFWAHVLPKWPLWAHLFYSVLYSVSGLRRACFRQARVAQTVLPSGALFRAADFQGGSTRHPCAPKSHMCPLPHLGLSNLNISRCKLFRNFSYCNSCLGSSLRTLF